LIAGAAGAAAQPSTGTWVGSTSQSEAIGFTVINGGTAIQPLSISFTFPSCMSGTIDLTSSIAIDGKTNTFSASGGFCPTFSIQGTFNSTTTASGSAHFVATYIPYACGCSGTVNTTWSASKSAGSADLAISKTDGVDKVAPGGAVTYTLTVANNGPNAVNSLTLTDNVPSVIQNPVFTPATGSYNPSSKAWTGLSLGGGQSVTMSLSGTISVSAVGSVSNTATVAPPAGFSDPNTANNSSTDTDIVSTDADVGVTQTGPATVTPPSHATYVVRVTNAGPATAQGVQVTATPPSGLTFVGNAGACTTVFPCSLGTVASGQTRVIYATYTIPESYSGPSTFSHSVTVSATSPDSNTGNQFASTSTSTDTPGTATLFRTVIPCRILDTRQSSPLAAGADRLVPVASGACGVPGTAKAVALNLTVTEPDSPGDLRLYPAGSPLPLVSAINYAPGQTRANNAVVPVGTGGQIGVHNDQTQGSVQFIVDVTGYFE
jgi:uncharacterized repeat protein (TIGR01451 family)